MATATLTSKGRITIPVEVRKALGVDTGDRVAFVEVAPGRYEFMAATHSGKTVTFDRDAAKSGGMTLLR